MAAVAMGGGGLGGGSPSQPSKPTDYFDPKVEERQTEGCDDDSDDNSDPEDLNLDDGQVVPEDQRLFLDFDIIATRPRFTKEVGGILAGRFKQPWISFKKVPKEEIEFWWRRFKEKYRWDPAINVAMRKEFNRRCSEFLIRHLGHARRSLEKPSWVKKKQWAEMWKQWNSDDYKKLCETAKANRKKNPAGSGMVYRGGSVSMATHLLRMRSSDGQPPSELAVYERCWKKKDGTLATPFSEKIAKKIAAFEKSRVELQHQGGSMSTPSNASSSSNQENSNKRKHALELGQQTQRQSEKANKGLAELQVDRNKSVPELDFDTHVVDPNKSVPELDFDTHVVDPNKSVPKLDFDPHVVDPNMHVPKLDFDPNKSVPKLDFDPNKSVPKLDFDPHVVDPNMHVPKLDFVPHVDPNKYVPKQDFDRLSAKYKNMKKRLSDMQRTQTTMMQLLSQMSSVFGQQQQPLQMTPPPFGQQHPPQMPPWSPWMSQWPPSPWCPPSYTGAGRTPGPDDPGRTSGPVGDAMNPITVGRQRANDVSDDDDVSDSF